MLSSFSYVSNSPCTKTTKRPKRSQAASHFATNLVHLATDGHKIFIQNFLFCKGKSGIPGFFISYSVIMYQSIPKPPIPPGIWLALSSIQWGIWPKMRPARWGIWFSCQNVCQRSETKRFRNSLIQHWHRIHGSLLLSIPHGFFCCCRFYIGEYAFV